jgi:antitoxin (DNA-binding transcriptional repressor) of toxin-antitoxin stability system
MASELTPVDIRRAPDLASLVEEVRASGKPRRIMRDDEEIARLVPVNPGRRRGRRTSATDPLWNLVGMVTTYDGPADVSENVDHYLAESHATTTA